VIDVEDWAEIRRLHRAERMSIEAIAKRLGIARNTVREALRSTEPPCYRRAGTGSFVDAAERAICSPPLLTRPLRGDLTDAAVLASCQATRDRMLADIYDISGASSSFLHRNGSLSCNVTSPCRRHRSRGARRTTRPRRPRPRCLRPDPPAIKQPFPATANRPFASACWSGSCPVLASRRRRHSTCVEYGGQVRNSGASTVALIRRRW
jgi:hypothetical protein